MRCPGLIETNKEFLAVTRETINLTAIQSSLLDVKKLPNDELAVKEHIKGVVHQ